MFTTKTNFVLITRNRQYTLWQRVSNTNRVVSRWYRGSNRFIPIMSAMTHDGVWKKAASTESLSESAMRARYNRARTYRLEAWTDERGEAFIQEHIELFL